MSTIKFNPKPKPKGTKAKQIKRIKLSALTRSKRQSKQGTLFHLDFSIFCSVHLQVTVLFRKTHSDLS